MLRAFAGAMLCSCVFVASLSAADRFELRVLYCGVPGSAREADFESFLKRHFTSVILADDIAFKEEQADQADVVIFDWTAIFKADGSVDLKNLDRMRNPVTTLSEKYTRPTILIGLRGGMIGRMRRLKTDHFCNCLDGPAHRVALEHPLFHTPLKVDPEIDEIPTREEYGDQTIDRTLGPTMKVWHVQTKKYPEIDPGNVACLYGFADSPDSEVIAQGNSQKGPDTLALGRQANFFHWGFFAPPSDMTPSGQRLFVNVVAYMRNFDGQLPLVYKTTYFARSREWALRDALWPAYLAPEARARREKKYRANLGKSLKYNPEMWPKDALKDPDAYIKVRLESLLKQEVDLMTESLPEALREQYGMDTEKYWAYYTENFEYLYLPEAEESRRETPFLVDEDAKALGTSNRQVASLDKWISMLEQGNDPARAQRLLDRYTQEEFDAPEEWRAWLERNRKQLFFSDLGGYKFFVAPMARTADIPKG